jgi:arylsulfatase A-like enzyme
MKKNQPTYHYLPAIAIYLSATILVICSSSSGFLYAQNEVSQKPNIIMISIDTLRPDHTGAYGYSRNTSPFLDELAKDMTVFKNCYAHASWTPPSVASLFTSLYPTQHGSLGKDRIVLMDENITAAEILRDSGYNTAAFSSSPFIHPDFGFGQGFKYFGFDETENANALNKQIDKWLKNHSKHSESKPLFLYVMYFDPHYPYVAPDNYNKKFNKAPDGSPLWKKERVTKLDTLFDIDVGVGRDTYEYLKSSYDSEISYTDDALKKLIKSLKESGIYNSNKDILVLTSDHGEEFIEHSAYGHGSTLYEEVLKVLCMIKAPGIVSKKSIDSPVSQIDILPTIFEIAGVPVPDKIEGKSLFPLLKGDTQGHERLVYATSQTLLDDKQSLRSIRKGRYKFILRTNPDRAELYDLSLDPEELLDLAPQRSDLVLEMTNAMLEKEKSMLPPVKGNNLTPPPDRTKELLKSLSYIQD